MFVNTNASINRGTTTLRPDSENVPLNGVRGGGLKQRALKTMVTIQPNHVGVSHNHAYNTRRNALKVLDMNLHPTIMPISKIQPAVISNDTTLGFLTHQDPLKESTATKGTTMDKVREEDVTIITSTVQKKNTTITSAEDKTLEKGVATKWVQKEAVIAQTCMTTEHSKELVLMATIENVLDDAMRIRSTTTVTFKAFPNIDREDRWDIQAMAEYVNDVYQYLFDIEKNYMPNIENAEQLASTNWKYRGVLVNWIIQAHYRLKMVPETLFMAINYLDRFLALREVSRDKIQLLGATALLVASKYEEVYPPPVNDFVYISDAFYTGDQFLHMERTLLKVLDFRLGIPTPLHFLRRISKAEDVNMDIRTRTLGKYFMEVTLLYKRFIQYPPSMVGAASMWLARFMLKRGPWLPALEYHSHYTEQELRPLISDLLFVLGKEVKLDAVHNKYATDKCLRASLFAEQFVQNCLEKRSGSYSKINEK
jgi:hypothetical protein